MRFESETSCEGRLTRLLVVVSPARPGRDWSWVWGTLTPTSADFVPASDHVRPKYSSHLFSCKQAVHAATSNWHELRSRDGDWSCSDRVCVIGSKSWSRHKIIIKSNDWSCNNRPRASAFALPLRDSVAVVNAISLLFAVAWLSGNSQCC